MKAETITGVNALPLEEGEIKKGKVEKKAGKRIGYNYIVVKSFKESQKNDVVKCLYIKSLTKWGFCVIKEGTSGDTKDKHGRDIRDRLIWQKQLHEQLMDKIRLPKFYGSFEENGNYYLVIEHIKGKSLGSVIRKEGRKLREQLINGGSSGEKFLGYLIQITDLLIILHNEGIVHRDATAGNFMITKRGRVAVIDMELSYSMRQEFPSPPFELGTTGYMSPQQERVHTPTIHEDIFAIGAIILQVWTGISPSKMTKPPAGELADRVRFFIPDNRLSEIVYRCLLHDASDRCSLEELRAGLISYKSDLAKKKFRNVAITKDFSRSALEDIVQKGISSVCSPLMADVEKGWFAQNQQTMNDDKNKIDKEYYASVQFGTAGVMYFFSKVAKLGFDIEDALTHIQSGLKLIGKKYINRLDNTSPGFYYGGAGVSVAMQSLHQQGVLLDEKFEDWAKALLLNTNNEWGLLNGRTGHGMALLQTRSLWEEQELKGRLIQDKEFLLALQQKDGSWAYPPAAKSKKLRVLPGFLNGVAGTVYYLLEYGKLYNDHHALLAAENGLQYLMRSSYRYEGRLVWKSASGKRLGYGWCDGSSGIAFSFIRAFEVTGNALYRKYAEDALSGILPKIADNGLSQCHGISGLGEVYLEAFRVFRDEQWFQRASWIKESLLHLRLQNSKGLYWLVETERQPIPGFMIGNSGILHFLLRYLYPDSIYFPFLSVSETTESKIMNVIQSDPGGLQPIIA